jgi:putative flippase GtrA
MKRLRGELGRFLIVGGTTVAIDLASYRLLLWIGLAVALAKGLGFIAGTIFAYHANRLWTFAAEGGRWRFAGFLALYAITLGVNVGVNSGALLLLGVGELALAIAFLAATGASATLNFLGMKFLVFNPGAWARGRGG